MQSSTSEPKEISTDDEDENECRLSCSLRWLISKAYPQGSIPDYLPHSHFFQLEDDERYLSPDIALVLLSGDLYIRAFQQITHQDDQFFTYEELIEYFHREHHIHLDLNALKQDDPLNANIHLEFIDHFIKLYGRIHLDSHLLSERFERLQLKSLSSLVHQSTSLTLDSFLIIWLNGICEHMSQQLSQRIPPVIDLRLALIDGRCLCSLLCYYDEEYLKESQRNDLQFFRSYINHYHGEKMTNLFPFSIKHLRENLIPDLNLQAMLIDLFVLFEVKSTEKFNLTYSINDEEEEEEDISPSPNTTTWQRQAASNHSTPMTSSRTKDDIQINPEYVAVKMQLEMKKRAIERDKQRLESVRDNKRQTISQEAFKQLLQQKSRQNAILNNDHNGSSIRKSRTTTELTKPEEKETSSIVDLSKPMNREEFFETLELLKKKFIETSPPPHDEPSNTDHHHINGIVPEKSNGLVMELIDDPSQSTMIEMERKRELVFQKQQQRLDAYERQRQRREMENHHRDDQRKKKDLEEMTKKVEREQRRDEIYRQYLMKKENKPEMILDEHPMIKVRTKNCSSTNIPKEHDLNDTQSLSFVRLDDHRKTKVLSKIDSRTLTRPITRSTLNETSALPLIPVSEPRYPLAKPLSGKSNKQTIINALTQVILAGRVNDRVREQVCEEIEKHNDKVKHFILLFRDSRLQFRSVYAFIPNTLDTPPRLERLYGQGPKEINETMVDNFYKYNNGSKQFSKVPIKSFSVQCDAITINNHYWSQSTTTKRTNSTHFNTQTTTTTTESNQS